MLFFHYLVKILIKSSYGYAKAYKVGIGMYHHKLMSCDRV